MEKVTLSQILKDKELMEMSTESVEIVVDVLKDVKDIDIPYVGTALKVLFLPAKIKEFLNQKNRKIFERIKNDQ